MAYPTTKAQAIEHIADILNNKLTKDNAFVWKEIVKNLIVDFDITKQDLEA